MGRHGAEQLNQPVTDSSCQAPGRNKCRLTCMLNALRIHWPVQKMRKTRFKQPDHGTWRMGFIS
jgi:hypothetical protein